MHNNYYTVALFVWSGLMFAAGMGVGQLLCVKRRHGKATIGIEPVVSERWEAIKTMAWVMAIVMFVSVMFYSLQFTYEQRECNYDFYDRLDYRTGIATSDRALSDRRDAALAKMVNDLLVIPPGTQGGARVVLNEYQDTIEAINAQAAQNEKQRRENPLPTCARR